MPTSNTALSRLRRRLRRGEALLLTHLPSVLYLTGFRGSSGVLVLTRNETVFFAAGLYRLQARQEVRGARVQVTAGEPLAGAVEWLRRKRLQRVSYEERHLSAAQLEQVRERLESKAELHPAGSPVEKLRGVKTAEEVGRIRSAVELTARVFEEVLPLVRPGVRELDLAAELDYRMKRRGARGPAFETIVASGPRSALPHGRATAKRLAKNELVVFDLGAILGDYQSDLTRTVYLGNPPARVRSVYKAVQDALQAAQATVAAGVSAAYVDQAARRCLSRRRLGAYFVHGTGHGLGLEIHEEPRVARGVETKLAAGNVITLEPGVYLPGWGGVRIEDVVVVRRHGAELLTPLSTELICL